MDHTTNNSGLPTASRFAFPQGLEKELWNTGSSVAEIIAIPPNITCRYIMPGINQHPRTITGLDDALAYSHRTRAAVNPAVNDDFGNVRLQFSNYRKRIFNTIIILPNDADETQESQWDMFVRAMFNGRFDLKDIEAKSWIITEEIIKLHEQDTTLPAKHDKSLRSPADRYLTCSQRMETIMNCLLYSKSVCVDIMETDLAMLRFIAAPNAVMKAKKQDKDGNLGVNQTLAAIQADVASASAPPRIRPAGHPRTTIGPQPPVRGGMAGLTTSHPPSSTGGKNRLLPPISFNRAPANMNNPFAAGAKSNSKPGRISLINDPSGNVNAMNDSTSDQTASRSGPGGNAGTISPASPTAVPSWSRKRRRAENQEAETEQNESSGGE